MTAAISSSPLPSSPGDPCSVWSHAQHHCPASHRAVKAIPADSASGHMLTCLQQLRLKSGYLTSTQVRRGQAPRNKLIQPQAANIASRKKTAATDWTLTQCVPQCQSPELQIVPCAAGAPKTLCFPATTIDVRNPPGCAASLAWRSVEQYSASPQQSSEHHAQQQERLHHTLYGVARLVL